MVKCANSVTTLLPRCKSVVKFGFEIASMSLRTVFAAVKSLFASESVLASQAVFISMSWKLVGAPINGVITD